MKQHIWLYDNNLLTFEGAGALEFRIHDTTNNAKGW